jgi:hypothetical protein
MKIDMVNVPELDEVEGAEECNIQISRIPCGICYTTRFFRGVELLQQHQHVVVDPKILQLQSAEPRLSA